jgi:hypothetical protein
MERLLTVIGAIVFVLILVATVSCLMAWPVMLLWNWLIPTIFKLPQIDFWQALGLNLLASILFKSSSYKSSGGT